MSQQPPPPFHDTKGKGNTEELGIMCRSFLLFRGALMNKEWIEDWRQVIGHQMINLHGNTSTSKNLDVALGFSKCHNNHEENQLPVLFIYSINNFYGFKGFRLNDKRFSVYPEEQEFLLMEGFKVFVLDVQYGFKISNKFLARYNNK